MSNLKISLKKIQTNFIQLSLISIICGIAASLLLYGASMTAYDTDVGHFRSGFLAYGFVAFFILTVLLSIASGAVLFRRASSVKIPESNHLTSISSALLAIALAYYGYVSGILPIINAVEISSAYGYSVYKIITSTGMLPSVLMGIFAIISAVYFIFEVLGKKFAKCQPFLSICVSAWALMKALEIYFNKSTTINSPVKSVLLLGAIANLMFFTEDVRFRIGNQIAPLYGFLATLAASLGFAISIPFTLISSMELIGASSSMIFASPEGIYSAFGLDILYSLISLLITLFALSRLVRFSDSLVAYIPKKKATEADVKDAEQPDSEEK